MRDNESGESARACVEVLAGLLPGKDPDPIYTRRYWLTTSEWERARQNGQQAQVLAEVNGRAIGYASLLMGSPDRLNWVRVDWVWF